MMQGLMHQMRLEALLAGDLEAKVKRGIVSSYNPQTYAAKVHTQPEDVETTWLPVASLWVGNGWGLFCPPTAGDQVVVIYAEGSVEAGIIIGGLFSDVNAPLSVPSGEFWLVHQSGASIKLTNDKKLTLTDGGGSVAVMNGDGTGSVTFANGYTINANTTINGSLAVTEAITSEQTVTGQVDVVGGGKSLKGHVHTGVQSGSSDTGTPA